MNTPPVFGIFNYKITPPHLVPESTLIRAGLLEQMCTQARANTPILIEAQAGQGKTTLALQYLHICASEKFSWYRMTSEDSDPIVFATGLLAAIMRGIPGFQIRTLEDMLTRGSLTPREAEQAIEMICSQLSFALTEVHHLVIDDAHLISAFPLSLALLDSLLVKAPPKLQIILTARYGLSAHQEICLSGKGSLVIDNAGLALTRSEIAQLFSVVLDLPATPHFLDSMHSTTDGWITGLLLIGHDLKRRGTRQPATNIPTLKQFFEQEAFTYLIGDYKRPLFMLSLLDEIPADIATSMPGFGDLSNALNRLAQDNCFVRRLQGGTSPYIFHSLFCDFLRREAATELKEAEQREWLATVARHYQASGDLEKALRYFLKIRDYSAAESIIIEVGPRLLALNRTMTLQNVLADIPDDAISSWPWLCYFKAIASLDQNPSLALTLLEQALAEFLAADDCVGELLALGSKIYFHIAFDGRLELGASLLSRAHALFASWADALPVSARIMVAQHLAMGFCWFDRDLIQSDSYTSLALRMSQEHGLHDATALVRVIRCYQFCFSGNWAGFRREIEASLSLLKMATVSTRSKICLEFSQVNLLFMEGDFFNYREKRLQLERGRELLARMILGPFLFRIDIEMAIAEGRYADALEDAMRGLATGPVAANPHLRSLFLQFYGYALAALGQPAKAIEALQESLRLRALAGGRMFILLNEMVVGAALARLGMDDPALRHLDTALSLADQSGDAVVKAGALAHRACVLLRRDRPAALDTIRACLQTIRQAEYRHFFCWDPVVMRTVLSTAVDAEIMAEEARRLAALRLGMALLPHGNAVPILRIRILGGLAIDLDGGLTISGEALTPVQRELLAMLATSPSLSLSQTEIQVAMWPDSPPDRSRAAFDTLLSRLRKFLDKAFAPDSSKPYLSLQKSVLRLENCQVDAREMFGLLKTGLRHVKRHELWQASNAFRAGFHFWQGELLPGFVTHDDVCRFRDHLNQVVQESALAWSRILASQGEREEALRMAAEAVRIDGLNPTAVQELYSLHAEAGDQAKAIKVLRDYEEALKAEGFSRQEIERSLELLWNPEMR